MSTSIRIERQVEAWLKAGPTWLIIAYRQNMTVQRVLVRCAAAGFSTEAMLWRLAAALYERGNHWEASADFYMQRNLAPELNIQIQKDES